jgi:hypothetical protein
VAEEAVLLVTDIQNTNDCSESKLPHSVFYEDPLAEKTLKLLQPCNKGKKNGLLGNTIHTHAP